MNNGEPADNQMKIEKMELRKRRFTMPPVLAKRPRLMRQISTPDYSTLPTEILLKIIGNLNKEDNCILPLSQSCKRMYEICSPSFDLVVNFSSTPLKKYPEIVRSYTNIRIVGSEIDPDEAKLEKIFKTSKDSAKSLKIEPPEDAAKCRVYLRSLLAIFNYLPNLSSIELVGVQALMPQLSYEKIPEKKIPSLKKLKTLKLEDCYDSVLNCFTKATSIEDFQVSSIQGAFMKRLKLITLKQKKLKSLRTVLGGLRGNENFEKLCTLELPAISSEHFSRPKSIFMKSPNLEHLKMLRWRFDTGRHEHQMGFLMSHQSNKLRTIVVEGRVANSLDMDRVHINFPNLEKFTSANVKWTK